MRKPIPFSRHFCFLLLLSIFSNSCSKKEKEPFLDAEFENTPIVEVKSIPLKIEETEDLFFGKILEMVYVDSLLIIRDIDQTHRMKIVDLKSNKITRLGKIGEGPNELISNFTRPSMDFKNNMLYVSDYPRYYVYNIDSLKKGINLEPSQKIKINLEEDNLIESTFASGYIIGALFNNRFGLHRLSDGEFSKMGDYEYGTYMSHQGMFYAHPTEKKAVCLDLFAQEYSILDFTDGDLKIIKDYKGWSSKQKEVEKEGGIVSVIPPLDDKNCFMSCATTEKYIYALYSGKLRGLSTETSFDPSYCNIIYVFDWEGVPVKKIQLDTYVRSIAIDEENQVLYASTIIDENPQLVKFNL